jgi:hypothetical protein
MAGLQAQAPLQGLYMAATMPDAGVAWDWRQPASHHLAGDDQSMLHGITPTVLAAGKNFDATLGRRSCPAASSATRQCC